MGRAQLGTTPNSWTKFFIQTPSLAASVAAMYSASVVESATVACLFDFQVTAPPLSKITYPDVDLKSSTSDWKLESVKPSMTNSFAAYTKRRSGVCLRYLSMVFAAPQWAVPGSD